MDADGQWRIRQVPALAWRLARRVWRGGQRVTQLPPSTPFPYPLPVSAERLAPYRGRPIQLPREGTGPLFYRRYALEFLAPGATAAALMAPVQADPNTFSPQALAHYRKTRGARGRLAVGDEFFIRMTGPWNAPVRVIDVTPTSFAFATLHAHMEAGEIAFEIQALGAERFRFRVQSWARSRDGLVDLAYDKLKLAQRIQNEMWTSFAECVVRTSGGAPLGPVVISVLRREMA